MGILIEGLDFPEKGEFIAISIYEDGSVIHKSSIDGREIVVGKAKPAMPSPISKMVRGAEAAIDAEAQYIKKDDVLKLILDAKMMYSPTEAEAGYTISRIIDAVCNLPAEDVKPMKWLSVSDALPCQDGSTMICTDKGSVCSAKYYTGSKKWNGAAGPHVKYWMPLPLPPKEE